VAGVFEVGEVRVSHWSSTWVSFLGAHGVLDLIYEMGDLKVGLSIHRMGLRY
jgi:hypothetical protein